MPRAKTLARKSRHRGRAQSNAWYLAQSKLIVIAISGLCALVLISYANSMYNGFVWDDNQQIVMNPDLRPGAPWTRLFTSDVWGSTHGDQPARTNYYRPLQMVTYRLTSELFGLEPLHLHLLSIAFALAAVLASFLAYLRLTGRVALAFVAAALFAVHPVHAEAVDWISALPEIGCATCFLFAFGLFFSTRRGWDPTASPTASALRWCLSVAMFAMALLWKETAVVFPVIVAAYVFFNGSPSVGQRLRSSAKVSFPFWCVLAGYLVVRFRTLGFLATRQRIWDLTPVQVALSLLHLMPLYGWKLILPIQLNAYYVFVPVRSVLDVRACFGILFAVLSCFFIWYGFRRAPLAGFATLWVFVTLLPVMDIYALGRNVFAERYLYLPSFGFCLLVTLLATAAIKRLSEKFQKPVSVVLLVSALVWFSAQTIARNPDWNNDATLFRKALILSPNAPFVHFMVASTQADDPAAGASAEGHYLRAVELAESEKPPDLLDLSRAYEGLTSLYTDRGDYVHALEIVHKWRSATPGQPEVDTEEGLILLKSGKWREAEPLLNGAFATRPKNENVLNALGLLAWQYQGNLEGAVNFFTRALAIHTAKDDFQASLHNNLGGVYGDLQQFPLALKQFQSAVDISPDDPEYHTNLATALAATHRYDQAAAEAGLALRIDPSYPPARALLQQLNAQVTRQR